MILIHCNRHLKSGRNRKTFWKNTKLKTFINKYNWEGRNSTSEKDDGKKFEKDNRTIALNVFHAKKEKCILPLFQNITEIWKTSYLFNDFQWSKMALSCREKEISVLLREITSKHYSDFYCLNCLHSFRTEYKLKSHKNLCENKIFIML